MSSFESEKLFFPLILFLAFFSVSAQTGGFPFIDNDLQQGMMAAVKENKDFATTDAKRSEAWNRLDVLRKELASRNPELMQLLYEQRALRKLLAETGNTEKADKKTGMPRARLNEITLKLENEFSKSGDYALASLHFSRISAEAGLVFQKILYSSSDERIKKFLEAVDKNSGIYITYSVRAYPKADVEGSDEYRVAVKGIEKYRDNPNGFKGSMENCCSFVRERMEWRAGNEPLIRELKRRKSLADAECFLRRCLVEEKHPDIAWRIKTLPNSPEFQTPEGAGKYEALQTELNRIIHSDSEYAALEKEKQKLQKEYQKALDGFAAKSDAPEAVEYRKVKVLLDGLGKTASDSRK